MWKHKINNLGRHSVVRHYKTKVRVSSLSAEQSDFVNFVLEQYVEQGYTELSLENLPELIKLKYGTINDAKNVLGPLGEISKVFIDFQKYLYAA